MSNDIAPFDFEGAKIRAVLINDEVWMVASDIATVLGYADPDKAVRQHCKAMKRFNSAELAELGLANPPPSGLVLIPERDVYRLIMRSSLPAAERFENWVVADVLPTVRKTGVYAREELEITAEGMRRLGGMQKAIMQKLLSEVVMPILTEMRTEYLTIAGGYDAARNQVVDFIPMAEHLEKSGVIDKRGRGHLSSRCSALVIKFAKLQNPNRDHQIKAMKFGKQSKYVFHVDLLRDWMAEEGRGIIRAHREKTMGQTVMPFGDSRKKPTDAG
jgi:prophage antirepressor-like protein